MTGDYKITPFKRDPKGNITTCEEDDPKLEAFSLYREDFEGIFRWRSDHATKEEAKAEMLDELFASGSAWTVEESKTEDGVWILK